MKVRVPPMPVPSVTLVSLIERFGDASLSWIVPASVVEVPMTTSLSLVVKSTSNSSSNSSTRSPTMGTLTVFDESPGAKVSVSPTVV